MTGDPNRPGSVGRRSITLTGEGALFLERCRRIFSEIKAAELELSQTQEAPRGTLRVGLPMAVMLMMPTLVVFMRAYPEIMLDLDFSDRVVDVIEEASTPSCALPTLATRA